MSASFAVVIPAYNAARFLPRCLASVARQTYAPASIVVVDDASSDETADVARGLGAAVLRIEHGGPARARNAGVALADAPWVAFLDADDEWSPTKLERYAAAVRICPDVHLVFGDYAVSERGSEVPSWFAADPHVRALDLRHVAPGIARCGRASLVEGIVRSLTFMQTSSLAVRRDAFLACGGYDPDLLIAEDFDLLLRLLSRSTAAVVCEPLATYHRHATNLSADPLANVDWEGRVIGLVSAYPDRYPERAAQLLATARPARLSRAATWALRDGRYGAARSYYEQSWHDRPSIAAALGIALASILDMPGAAAMHQVARGLWRRVRRVPA